MEELMRDFTSRFSVHAKPMKNSQSKRIGSFGVSKAAGQGDWDLGSFQGRGFAFISWCLPGGKWRGKAK
jgi:hypothetical protein